MLYVTQSMIIERNFHCNHNTSSSSSSSAFHLIARCLPIYILKQTPILPHHIRKITKLSFQINLMPLLLHSYYNILNLVVPVIKKVCFQKMHKAFDYFIFLFSFLVFFSVPHFLTWITRFTSLTNLNLYLLSNCFPFLNIQTINVRSKRIMFFLFSLNRGCQVYLQPQTRHRLYFSIIYQKRSELEV